MQPWKRKPDAPPENCCSILPRPTLRCWAVASHGWKKIQKYELKFVKSADRRFTATLNTHVAAVTVTFSKDRMNPERKEILALPCLPGRLTLAETASAARLRAGPHCHSDQPRPVETIGASPASAVKYFASIEIEALRMIPSGWPKPATLSGKMEGQERARGE